MFIVRIVGKVIALLRILWLLLLIPPFLLVISISGIIMGWKMDRALRIRRLYIKWVNWGLGLKITVIGKIPDVPGLYVSNHRNFLDPFVALEYIDSLPIAKSEVADYPFIGLGAKITGIVYVNRDQKSSRLSTLEAIKNWILKGYRILIYPEGTVYNGTTTKEFKPGAFRIATKEGFKVIPMAIEYKLKSDHWPDHVSTASFVFQVLSKWKTYVTLSIGTPRVFTDTQESLSFNERWINDELIQARIRYSSKLM